MLYKLLNQPIVNQTWRIIKPNFYILARVTCSTPCPPTTITLKGVKYQKPGKKPIDHDLTNMKRGRPMSPHLNIYRHELHSNLSIIHRMTGVVSALYAILLGLQALILPCQIEYYICSLEEFELGRVPIAALKFIITFPFIYHYCNGIRHLVWDATACCLTMKQVHLTGYIMLGCAFSVCGLIIFL